MTGWIRHRRKPPALLALHATSARLFLLARAEFSVPEAFTLRLRNVDDSSPDITYHAARAMDGSQILRRVATPGVEISGEEAIVACSYLAWTLERLIPQAREPNRLAIAKIRDDLNAVVAELSDPDELWTTYL
jgi:hypothetical protein